MTLTVPRRERKSGESGPREVRRRCRGGENGVCHTHMRPALSVRTRVEGSSRRACSQLGVGAVQLVVLLLEAHRLLVSLTRRHLEVPLQELHLRSACTCARASR